MSEKSTSPNTDGTKKDLIIRLLDQGTPAPEIARLVGTSVGYVYKETALLKSKSEGKTVVTRSRNTTVSLDPNSSTHRGRSTGVERISRIDKVEIEVEHNPLMSAPPLDNEAVKIVFAAFAKGEEPAQILAKHGFNPEAVEIEYRRFLRLTGQNRDALTKEITNQLITAKSFTVNKIIQSFKEKGLLSNDQLSMLLTLELAHRFQSGQNDVISSMTDISSPLPEGWERPLCYMCRAPVEGIIFQGNTPVASWMRASKFPCARHVS